MTEDVLAMVRESIQDRRKAFLPMKALIGRLQKQGWTEASRDKIHKIETGVREVSLEDFLHLAVALDVTPGDLLMGTPRVKTRTAPARIELCGAKATQWEIHRWITSRRPLVRRRDRSGERETYVYLHTTDKGHRRHFQHTAVDDLETRLDVLIRAFKIGNQEGLRKAGHDLKQQVDLSVIQLLTTLRQEAERS